jgi:tRNA(Arg) A34 adenosine deaminase TadA
MSGLPAQEDLHLDFMRRAVAIGREGMHAGQGGPFGALVVKRGVIVAESSNCVTSAIDPTAHAEVMAIRKACQELQTFILKDCTLYTSCEPCPMCLGAIYWARLDRVFFAAFHSDAAKANFDDSLIYSELDKKPADRKIPMKQMLRAEGVALFNEWIRMDDKTVY